MFSFKLSNGVGGERILLRQEQYLYNKTANENLRAPEVRYLSVF